MCDRESRLPFVVVVKVVPIRLVRYDIALGHLKRKIEKVVMVKMKAQRPAVSGTFLISAMNSTVSRWD
jgi:hypothetical protein